MMLINFHNYEESLDDDQFSCKGKNLTFHEHLVLNDSNQNLYYQDYFAPLFQLNQMLL